MKILDRLPIAVAASAEIVQGEIVRVRPYQIIVWVSVGIRQIAEWDQRCPRLPAILDTGNNHNFSIGHGHLFRWAGIQLPALRRLRTIRDRDNLVPLHAASLWLHPNIPGERAASGATPISLNVDKGIAVYPDEIGPRLPVLGLRALAVNHLQLAMDGQQLQVSLRTLDWRAKLFRYLS